MLQPRQKTIDTTQGEITFRALSRKEGRQIQNILRKVSKTESETDKLDAMDEMDKVIFGALVGVTEETLDSLDIGEYNYLREEIQRFSAEYVEKN